MAPSSNAAQAAYRKRAERYENESYYRAIRIINITIGKHAVFAGSITLEEPLRDRKAKARSDEDLLASVTAQYDAGNVAAYWADDSIKRTKAHDDILGAGVAWRERDEQGYWAWQTQSFPLGLETGSVTDTKLFGIAAALGLAVERIGSISVVKVFSDSQTVLRGIQRSDIWSLGRAVSSPWALEDVYNHAEVLTKAGVGVELVWVKGHAWSIGNIKADGAAAEAARSQLGMKRRWIRKEDASTEMVRGGRDSVEEWLARQNRHWILEGTKPCNDDEARGDEEGAASDGSADMEITSEEEHTPYAAARPARGRRLDSKPTTLYLPETPFHPPTHTLLLLIGRCCLSVNNRYTPPTFSVLFRCHSNLFIPTSAPLLQCPAYLLLSTFRRERGRSLPHTDDPWTSLPAAMVLHVR